MNSDCATDGIGLGVIFAALANIIAVVLSLFA